MLSQSYAAIDQHYKARFSIAQLAKLFGVQYVELEKTLVLADVNVV